MSESPEGPSLASSFRDPSGRLFQHKGTLHRSVAISYAAHYDKLMRSGLYQRLMGDGLLIEHEEVDPAVFGEPVKLHRVLRPRLVPFISYPYEWCFGQMRAAALATLRIQRLALEHGMMLKDASAYNIQFVGNRPLLIDTLSFEAAQEGQPWPAYRQFCTHFLAPLALMAQRDERLGQLSRLWMDGIPLDLASKLLPWKSRLSLGIQSHIHLHARFQAKYADTHGGEQTQKARAANVSRTGQRGLLDNLEGLVRGTCRAGVASEWGDYYNDTNYTERGLRHKETEVRRLIERTGAGTIWDIGANNGHFSRIAAERGAFVLSVDGDHEAVEYNFKQCREQKMPHIHPLLVDLSNPSPAIGWRNCERMSLLERGPAELALALALMHHMAISNNVPFDLLADFFADCTNALIIEWVPKSDSQVQRLLIGRPDVFESYANDAFVNAFSRRFQIVESVPIQDSERILYLMRKKMGMSDWT